MAATKWKTERVLVEIAVHDESVTISDIRWAVQTALETHRTFDNVIRSRAPKGPPVRLGRLVVKHYNKVKVREKNEQG